MSLNSTLHFKCVNDILARAKTYASRVSVRLLWPSFLTYRLELTHRTLRVEMMVQFNIQEEAEMLNVKSVLKFAHMMVVRLYMIIVGFAIFDAPYINIFLKIAKIKNVRIANKLVLNLKILSRYGQGFQGSEHKKKMARAM